MPKIAEINPVISYEKLTVEDCSRVLDVEILVAVGFTQKMQIKKFVYHPWYRSYRILVADKIRVSCDDIHLRGLMESFNKM